MVMLAWELRNGYHSMAEALENFRSLDRYLLTFFTVQGNQKVWSAFLSWSKLDHMQAFNCVQYGTYPRINVYESDPFDKNGSFDPKFPNDIWVKPGLVKALHWAKNDMEKYQAEKSLEALILHELCHWGRHQNSIKDGSYTRSDGGFIDNPNGAIDTGDRFNMDAYTNPYQPWIP